MSQPDPILAVLTGAGSPFETGERDGLRQFMAAPPDLNMMIESARRFGDATFIVEPRSDGSERRLTFAEIFSWRDQLAAILDITPGARVAICMRNRTEWLVAFLAVMKAGGVAALLNSRGSPAELVAMIEDVSPALVLADSRRAGLIRDGGYTGRLLDLTQSAGTDSAPAANLPERAAAKADDPCVILFTSGTTGRVKGAVLSHRNLITGLMSVQLSGMMVLHNTARKLDMPVEALLKVMPQQAALLVYPLFHISGLASAFLSPLLAGSKVVIMRRWNAAAAIALVEREKITQFSGVPTMLWDIVHNAAATSTDLTSLRNIGCGGQALPINLLGAIQQACPQAVMGTGYGMTECAGAVAMGLGEDFLRKPSSAGRVLPLVEMRVEGPDGAVLGAGEVGELVVRGAQVMQGYWGKPEETAAVLSGDGWLRTGDIGMIDDEGYVFIIDRAKDMVISGGENIYCAEVERVLGELPQVTECAAFGIADARLGELLVAVVRAQGLSEQDIIDEVGNRLARYKAPGRVAFADSQLPRNAVGKVDKRQLRDQWPDLIREK